jgi:hypothetical protein
MKTHRQEGNNSEFVQAVDKLLQEMKLTQLLKSKASTN